MQAIIFFLRGGLVIKTDFSHTDDSLLVYKERKDFHHLLGKRLVVGFTRIQSDGAIMFDPKLR